MSEEDKKENKRRREQERRKEFGEAYGKLSVLLAEVDPSSGGTQRKASELSEGKTRIELIHRSISVIRRLQEENLMLRSRMQHGFGGDSSIEDKVRSSFWAYFSRIISLDRQDVMLIIPTLTPVESDSPGQYHPQQQQQQQHQAPPSPHSPRPRPRYSLPPPPPPPPPPPQRQHPYYDEPSSIYNIANAAVEAAYSTHPHPPSLYATASDRGPPLPPPHHSYLSAEQHHYATYRNSNPSAYSPPTSPRSPYGGSTSSSTHPPPIQLPNEQDRSAHHQQPHLHHHHPPPPATPPNNRTAHHHHRQQQEHHQNQQRQQHSPGPIAPNLYLDPTTATTTKQLDDHTSGRDSSDRR